MRLTLYVVALMISVLLMPGVLAQDFESRQGERMIQLDPTPAFESNQTVNMADTGVGDQTDLEKDALHPAFLEPGRFLGPYIHSSKFRFVYGNGGNFSFESTFNFTREQVMSGASLYWVRWPVDTSDFRSFCIDVFGILTPDVNDNPTGVYRRCDGTVRLDAIPPVGPAVPPFVGTLGAETIRDHSGLYVKEWLWLMPETDYRFNFTGTLYDDTTPSVWVTFERYQVEAATTFFANNELKGIVGREVLSIYPAFAFNFLAGVGESGLTSYRYPFAGDNTTFLTTRVAMSPNSGSNHLSLYVPFTGSVDVSWHIKAGWGAVGQNWTVNSTRQFLLTSSPNNVSAALLSTTTVDVALYPDQPVTLLGVVQHEDDTTGFYSGGPWAAHFADSVRWDNATDSLGKSVSSPQYDHGSQRTSPYANIAYTTGRWAQVTPGPFFSTYDFGWGRAFLFPGEVNLVMFLNNGTAIGFDSTVSIEEGPGANQDQCDKMFADSGAFAPVAGWLNGLACFILSLVGDVIGFISTVFQSIWGFLHQLGEWVYSAIVGFVDFVVRIITAMVEAATQIVFSLLTALPFILILFIAGKGLPDVTETLREGRQRARGSRDRRRREQ